MDRREILASACAAMVPAALCTSPTATATTPAAAHLAELFLKPIRTRWPGRSLSSDDVMHRLQFDAVSQLVAADPDVWWFSGLPGALALSPPQLSRWARSAGTQRLLDRATQRAGVKMFVLGYAGTDLGADPTVQGIAARISACLGLPHGAGCDIIRTLPFGPTVAVTLSVSDWQNLSNVEQDFLQEAASATLVAAEQYLPVTFEREPSALARDIAIVASALVADAAQSSELCGAINASYFQVLRARLA